MNAVQYIFLDRTLDMTPGKLAAQASHASVEGALAHAYFAQDTIGCQKDLWDAWREGKHYAKVTLETDDLFVTQAYLESRGFKTELIIDEGRTEFGGKLTPTAIGTWIVDKDKPHVRATFGEFDLYGTYERKLSLKVAAVPRVASRGTATVEPLPWGQGSIVKPKASVTRQQFEVIRNFLKK